MYVNAHRHADAHIEKLAHATRHTCAHMHSTHETHSLSYDHFVLCVSLQYRALQRFDASTDQTATEYFTETVYDDAIARASVLLAIMTITVCLMCVVNVVLCYDYANPVAQIAAGRRATTIYVSSADIDEIDADNVKGHDLPEPVIHYLRTTSHQSYAENNTRRVQEDNNMRTSGGDVNSVVRVEEHTPAVVNKEPISDVVLNPRVALSSSSSSNTAPSGDVVASAAVDVANNKSTSESTERQVLAHQSAASESRDSKDCIDGTVVPVDTMTAIVVRDVVEVINGTDEDGTTTGRHHALAACAPACESDGAERDTAILAIEYVPEDTPPSTSTVALDPSSRNGTAVSTSIQSGGGGASQLNGSEYKSVKMAVTAQCAAAEEESEAVRGLREDATHAHAASVPTCETETKTRQGDVHSVTEPEDALSCNIAGSSSCSDTHPNEIDTSDVAISATLSTGSTTTAVHDTDTQTDTCEPVDRSTEASHTAGESDIGTSSEPGDSDCVDDTCVRVPVTARKAAEDAAEAMITSSMGAAVDTLEGLLVVDDKGRRTVVLRKGDEAARVSFRVFKMPRWLCRGWHQAEPGRFVPTTITASTRRRCVWVYFVLFLVVIACYALLLEIEFRLDSAVKGAPELVNDVAKLMNPYLVDVIGANCAHFLMPACSQKGPLLS